MRILLALQNPKRSAAMAAAAPSAFTYRVFALKFLHSLTAHEPDANEPLEPPRSLTNVLLPIFLQNLRFNPIWATRRLDATPFFPG